MSEADTKTEIEITETIDSMEVVKVDEEILINATNIKVEFERQLQDTPVKTIVEALNAHGVMIDESDSVFSYPHDSLGEQSETGHSVDSAASVDEHVETLSCIPSRAPSALNIMHTQPAKVVVTEADEETQTSMSNLEDETKLPEMAKVEVEVNQDDLLEGLFIFDPVEEDQEQDQEKQVPSDESLDTSEQEKAMQTCGRNLHKRNTNATKAKTLPDSSSNSSSDEESDNDGDDFPASQGNEGDDFQSSQGNKTFYQLDNNNTVKLETTKIAEDDVCKTTIKRNRNTDSIKCLSLDHFDDNFVNDKEGKLRTERPYLWYEAIMEYVVSHEINNRVELMRRKNNKVSIVKVQMVFMESKVVVLQLNFVSGVMLVKGGYVRQWIKNEFSKILEIFTASLNSTTTLNLDEGKDQTKKKEEESLKKEKDTDLNTDISSIWADIESLKTAINSIEQGVLLLTKKMDSIAESCVNSATHQDDKLVAAEKRLDAKVSLYEEGLEECTRKQIEKVKTELRTRINVLEKEVTNFKESVDEKLVGVKYAPSEGVNDLRTEMVNLKKEVAELDVGVTRDLNTLDQDYESRYKSVDVKINSVKNDVNQEHLRKFSMLERKIEDLRKELQQSVSHREESINVDNNSIHSDDVPQHENPVPDETTVLVMCMDSNERHLIR